MRRLQLLGIKGRRNGVSTAERDAGVVTNYTQLPQSELPLSSRNKAYFHIRHKEVTEESVSQFHNIFIVTKSFLNSFINSVR